MILQSKKQGAYCYQKRKVKYCTGKSNIPNTPFLFSYLLGLSSYMTLLVYHFCAVISYHNISCPGKINYSFYICVSTMYYIITFTVLYQRAVMCLPVSETASSEKFPPHSVLLPALPLFFKLPSYSFPDAYPRCISLVLFLAKTLVTFLPGPG